MNRAFVIAGCAVAGATVFAVVVSYSYVKSTADRGRWTGKFFRRSGLEEAIATHGQPTNEAQN